MPEFSTNALRNRAGPIERDPGFAGGGGCDEGCDCLQKQSHFEDDFCGQVSESDWVISGTVIPRDRSNGWVGIVKGITSSAITEVKHCWSIAESGPPIVGANPPLRWLARVFVTGGPFPPSTSLGDSGFINTSDGRSFGFRIKSDAFGVLKWFAFATASIGVEVPTGKNVALTCPTAQTLEIFATKATIQFFINGTLVATILISSVPNLIGDVFKAFLDLLGLNEFQMSLEVDWICITQGRLCVDKGQD
jgi:hypothetical protein